MPLAFHGDGFQFRAADGVLLDALFLALNEYSGLARIGDDVGFDEILGCAGGELDGVLLRVGKEIPADGIVLVEVVLFALAPDTEARAATAEIIVLNETVIRVVQLDADMAARHVAALHG